MLPALAALVLAAVLGAPPRPINLVATPAVKTQLRATFISAHRQYQAAQVKGPLRGETYYGRYANTEYALAVFDVPRTGTTDQPELFRRPTGGHWLDRGDTGGEVCPSWVPLPLIKLWGFVPSSYSVVRGKRVYCYAPGP